MPKIISRAEAIKQGLKYFFTGKECKYGHISEWYTNQNYCMECNRVRRNKNWKQEKEELRAKQFNKIKITYRENKKIITRQEAKFNNKQYYFLKTPCIRGHIAERFTVNGQCIRCIYLKKQTSEYQEQRKVILKKYGSSEKNKKVQKKYMQSDKGKAVIRRSTKSEAYKKRIDLYKQSGKKAEIGKKWNQSEKGKKYLREKQKQPEYRVHHNIRNLLQKHLKNFNSKKSIKISNLVGGLNKTELINHFEKLFEKVMSWENYGGHDNLGWHIDHIVPTDYFIKNYDYTDVEIQKICWHHTNLRPMWAKENITKGNKISKKVAEKKIAEIRKQIGADKRSDV